MGGLDLGRHLRQAEQDRLVLRDRLSERLTLLRVRDAQFEGANGDAARARCDVHATHLDTVHHLIEALAGLSPRIWALSIRWPSKTISVVSMPL